jgi:shikimate kinase
LKKRPGTKGDSRKRTRARAERPVAKTRTTIFFLVGFMGAGKSSVGRALGQRLNWLFEDLDDRIEQHEGRKIAEIFRDSGEAHFRQAEHAALRQVLDERHGGAVRIVALGGGAFVQAANAALLRAAAVPTVFLDAPVEELWQRCRLQADAAGTERPLLGEFEQFRTLYRERRKHYAKAQVKIGTGGREVGAIAAEIAKKLSLKKIAMRTEEGESE